METNTKIAVAGRMVKRRDGLNEQIMLLACLLAAVKES
jgi:hypothetical protein